MATLVETSNPTPVVTPAPVEPQVPDQLNFDEMFAELSKPDEPPVPTPTPAPKAKEIIAPVEPELPLETPPAAATPTPTPEPTPKNDDDLLARFAEIVHTRAPAAPPPTPSPVVNQELFSAEEKAFLAQYEKDYADISKAETIRRRAEYNQLVGYVFSEVANTIRPLMAQLQTLADRSQLADLKSVEPEYDNLRDKVIAWIETQPDYLRPAYERVRDQGTADQVADLIQRYKQATGAPSAAVSQPVAQEPSLPAATKKAVASLAPVGSKRSVVISQDDPNDFGGSFEKFAKEF